MTSGTDSDSDEFFAEKLIGNGKLDKSIIGSQESLKSESCSAKEAGVEWSDMVKIRSLEEQLKTSSSILVDSTERGSEAYSYFQEGPANEKNRNQNNSRKRTFDQMEDISSTKHSQNKRLRIVNPKNRRHRELKKSKKHEKKEQSGLTSRSSSNPDVSQSQPVVKGKDVKKTDKRLALELSQSQPVVKGKDDKKTDKRLAPELYVPNRMLRRNYKKTTLFEAEFNTDDGEHEVAEQMASALGEKHQEIIEKIFELAGKEVSMQIFNETKKIESSGGLLVNNGQRRRTPGGVFIHLFKSNPGLADNVKKEFSEFTSQFQTKLPKHKKQEVKKPEEVLGGMEMDAAPEQLDTSNMKVLREAEEPDHTCEKPE